MKHQHFVEPLGGRNTILTNHLKMSVLKDYELRRKSSEKKKEPEDCTVAEERMA